MRQYYESEETERLEFARLAAKHFNDNPQDVTFRKDELEKGCLMALRWGLSMDCIVVIKLDDCFEPINYAQFIDRDKAAMAKQYHASGLAAISQGRNTK